MDKVDTTVQHVNDVANGLVVGDGMASTLFIAAILLGLGVYAFWRVIQKVMHKARKPVMIPAASVNSMIYKTELTLGQLIYRRRSLTVKEGMELERLLIILENIKEHVHAKVAVDNELIQGLIKDTLALRKRYDKRTG